MNISVEIENVYEDETVVTHVWSDVPHPDEGEVDLEDWAEEHLYPLTGTGRHEGDAGYFLTVTACDDATLVGCNFEWGI